MENQYNKILSDEKEFEALVSKALEDFGKQEDKRVSDTLKQMDEESVRQMLKYISREIEPISITSLLKQWWKQKHNICISIAAVLLLGIIMVKPIFLSDSSTNIKGNKSQEIKKEQTMPADTLLQETGKDSIKTPIGR